MPDHDDIIPGNEGQDIPIPANYPGSPIQPRPPGITGGIKSKEGSISPKADTWAKGHDANFGEKFTLLPKTSQTMVVGRDKRVSIPVAGIYYARPTMYLGSIPGVTWKQVGIDDVKTWALIFDDLNHEYTLDDADSFAEIMQRGLTPAYRHGKVIIRAENWYDNASELPDCEKVNIVDWRKLVSDRDAEIKSLKSKVKALEGSGQPSEKTEKVSDYNAAKREFELNLRWEKELREWRTIYIAIIVVIIVASILLNTWHPWMARK